MLVRIYHMQCACPCMHASYTIYREIIRPCKCHAAVPIYNYSIWRCDSILRPCHFHLMKLTDDVILHSVSRYRCNIIKLLTWHVFLEQNKAIYRATKFGDIVNSVYQKCTSHSIWNFQEMYIYILWSFHCRESHLKVDFLTHSLKKICHACELCF